MAKASEQDFPMPERAYSYGRISTGGRQSRGSGLRRQQGKVDEADASWPERVCKEQGWTLDEERFTDKRSGFHKKNLGPKAALARFLKLIERGRVSSGSVLLIDKLDRLTRADVHDAIDLFRQILRAGVSICTRSPFRIYREDAQDAFLQLFEMLIYAMANHQSSAAKKDNAEFAWQVSRHAARTEKKPHNNKPPFWLKKNGKSYVRLEQLVKMVETVRNMLLKGMGCGQVAAVMIAKGEPWPGRKGNWRGPGIWQLMTSRTLIGEYQPMVRVDGKRVPNGEPIHGFYPTVFTEDEFNALRLAMNARHHKRGRPAKNRTNVFVGLVYDAVTKDRLNMQTAHSHGKPIPYLSRGQIAGTVRVRYDHVEANILDTLDVLKPADIVDRPEEADERDKRIDELTARSTALLLREGQLRAKAANPDEDMETALEAASAAKAERKRVRRELDALKLQRSNGRVEALSEMQTLREYRDAATGDERDELDQRIQAALPSVVSAIWLQTQPVSERTQIVHVQIFLLNGTVRGSAILPARLPDGFRVWQLGDCDLRSGPFVAGRGIGNDALPS